MYWLRASFVLLLVAAAVSGRTASKRYQDAEDSGRFLFDLKSAFQGQQQQPCSYTFSSPVVSSPISSPIASPAPATSVISSYTTPINAPPVQIPVVVPAAAAQPAAPAAVAPGVASLTVAAASDEPLNDIDLDIDDFENNDVISFDDNESGRQSNNAAIQAAVYRNQVNALLRQQRVQRQRQTQRNRQRRRRAAAARRTAAQRQANQRRRRSQNIRQQRQRANNERRRRQIQRRSQSPVNIINRRLF